MAQTIEVKVPDIGEFHDVPVIEVLVKAGDKIRAEDGLLTLESDKAAMEVPSPAAGTVREVKVKAGDKLSQGSLILLLETEEASAQPQTPAAAPATPPAPAAAVPAAASAPPAESAKPASAVVSTPAALPSTPSSPPVATPVSQVSRVAASGEHVHASPSLRQFARELGVDMRAVQGSGPKGRILKEDVQAYVKGALAQRSGAAPGAAPAIGGGLNLLPWPKVDFAKFGPIESQPLSRIQKIAGANLARNWAMIPHVTQFDEADITELEAFRLSVNKEKSAEQQAAKLTMLAFLIKAVVAALKQFPNFNASLDGENLVLKRYVHIGFAADTPQGLVVPVIRDADKKGVLEIAQETAVLAGKAREGKLAPAEMQGGCFTISSLGGIGGTAFTPIVNAPEVAILGVSKSETKPKWDGKAFAPRLMLPLSLSYDHRVIDGAAGARFTAFVCKLLSDMRRAML